MYSTLRLILIRYAYHRKRMDLLDQTFYLLVLAAAVASVSWTITQEEIFREVREYFSNKSQTAENLAARKFFYAFTCEYCLSHWITLLFLLLTGYRLLFDDWRGYVIGFFVIPWLANQFMSLYRRLRVEIKHENLLAKKEEENLE